MTELAAEARTEFHAHRDPGERNWLDTEGHSIGTIFWRFVLQESAPDPIRCSVTKLPPKNPRPTSGGRGGDESSARPRLAQLR